MSTLYVDNIYSKTGTSQALDIDSSGRVLTPARPVFRATGPSPSNVTNQNYSTVTKLTFWDNEVFDVGSNFDSSTDYDFTAPVTGYYQINANVTLRDLVGGFVKMYLYKNGSVYTGAFSENESEGTEDRFTLVLSEVVQLDATDTIDVRIDTSSDTSLDFVVNESSFSGFLIG